MPLTDPVTLYLINDAHENWSSSEEDRSADDYARYWQTVERPSARIPQGKSLARARADVHVAGGFLDRFPLACLKYGLVDYVERWLYTHGARRGQQGLDDDSQPLFGWRTFHLHNAAAPFASADMVAFVRVHGAPNLLCAWGLGVEESMMLACKESFKIYYSLDADPLRVPPRVSRHFDLILVGEERQRAAVQAELPSVPCEILTPGPEFADFETFRPLGIPKHYDLVYVACAQVYKRHDILFHSMAALRDVRPVSCLCVCGYGELGEHLRSLARELRIDVDFIGPPGVSFAEVNRCINQARVGIVAGAEDGCPAILTEYMLADVPVLANADLCCGLRFIAPETGWAAPPHAFADGIHRALEECKGIRPRSYAIERWGFPTSVRKLEAMLSAYGFRPKRMTVQGG
jgi:glycosyltransferase involved in cell wall biosynthesis